MKEKNDKRVKNVKKWQYEWQYEQ